MTGAVTGYISSGGFTRRHLTRIPVGSGLAGSSVSQADKIGHGYIYNLDVSCRSWFPNKDPHWHRIR